ncbi:SPOR domain-containing protein [Flavobacterium jejuense]|uniref:SPOR domain-containing protein n=1 Tax=Flavobacterium jejuense TaxID=1544455 RepID=A0ABX0IXH7_9FLAO|nr:SPOR domain-containing protein [Flavobacterium jejuense]NHN27462.1 SPOR domain-containing protein [Flavobacterium jejuense]
MRKLTIKNYFYLSLISFFIASNSFSQENKTTVIQDPRFGKLLKEKQQLDNSNESDENYTIQIFYGDRETAKKTLMGFKKDFKEIEATYLYTNPTYKVWVGKYKLRINAEKDLVEIKKKYPTALLIKPNR